MTVILFILFFVLSGFSAHAEENGKDGSGLPLPRFASLKSDNVYVRAGPSMDYPIRWIYQREGLPVEIILEFDAWRKIRDPNGDIGWVHKILLSGSRTAIVQEKNAIPIFREENAQRPIAKAEAGVILHLEECGDLLCHAKVQGYEGWVEKKFLWGVYPSEKLN